MMQRIREIEAAFGDGSKNGPRGPEKEMAEKVRRSLHAARDIREGETLTGDMIAVKRPGKGIPPYLIGEIIGRTARQDIPADHWISWTML